MHRNLKSRITKSTLVDLGGRVLLGCKNRPVHHRGLLCRLVQALLLGLGFATATSPGRETLGDSATNLLSQHKWSCRFGDGKQTDLPVECSIMQIAFAT